eukprot:1303365-Amorphochlora_amoeboformis.AAC.2
MVAREAVVGLSDTCPWMSQPKKRVPNNFSVVRERSGLPWVPLALIIPTIHNISGDIEPLETGSIHIFY